jgi:chemotaxis family two-component system sensor kinase Cph1
MTHAQPTSSADAVTAQNVDLTNCDREQVHFPGAIQPHGAMLIVHEPDYIIRQASANCDVVLGRPARTLLGLHIADVFAAAPRMLEQMQRMSLENGPVHVVRESFAGSTNGVNIFAHRCGGVLILEVETIDVLPNEPTTHLYSDVRETIALLEGCQGLQNFFNLAVERIRVFTGYDRVMAYKFAEDGSGHVMAEAIPEGLEPYLGLHYPASDIPAPARRLFGSSWLRHLPDVDYEPVALVSDGEPAAPVDMSYAILRSVSVMYSGYLKNMGVRSTMVMPLMKQGQLWGLISAMHHSGPRHVPYEARMAAEFLSHMLSLLMSGKEDAEGYEQRLRMTAVSDQLVEALCRNPDLHASLAPPEQPNLMSLIPSQGAAIAARGTVSCIGQTPPEASITAFVDWLAKMNQPIFCTERLSELYPAASDFKSSASGVLAVRLSQQSRDFLLWFRPEHVEVVNWAGNPQKPVLVSESGGEVRLQPRHSFALWKQSVTGRSQPWHHDEREAASALRQSILEVILNRAEEVDRVNRQLAEVNVELDSFAYVASHDLKEPLRGVHHLASFLKRGQEGRFDDEGRQQLETILKLTRRMDDLIESLLQYSRTGRVELMLEPHDMDELVDEALMSCRRLITDHPADIRRPMPLETVVCDRVRVREVLSNLISNAVKYNDKANRWVEIGVEREGATRYYVRDNGIGIPASATDRIFDIFRRVHGEHEFGGGVGAGLTISRKTVERHGGRLWVESEPDKGSTFYFTLGPEKFA